MSFENLGDATTSTRQRGRATRNKPYRAGIVTAIEQNTKFPRVKVIFSDYDGMVSYWLPILIQGSHASKQFWVPSVGDLAIVLFDDRDEDGVVIGTIYSNADPPPGFTAPSALKLTSDNAGSVSSTPLVGSFDDMFTQAAATCPALATAISGVSGKNVLKALATTESSLNPAAVSEPARDGSRSWGLMQINTTAHPGYPPDVLTSQPELNIRLGTADLCGKLSHYGDINTALGHYKGWGGVYGSGMSVIGQGQVDKVTQIAQQLGTS